MRKRKPKRFISVALTVAVMFGVFTGVPGVNFSVSAEATYAELPEWTAISDRAGLEAMQGNRSGKYYLTNDIDLSGAEWTPIGLSDYGGGFTGTFDGQGYVIKNLKITENLSYSGLFGYVENATIKNVGLEGISINIAASFSVYAGGICGYGNNVEILNSYTEGNISAAGSHSYAGGLSGFSNGTIENCYTASNVSIVGNSNGNAGGLVGQCGSSLKISSCYVIGNVTASSSASSIYVGSLVGNGMSYAVITDCYRLSAQLITGGGIRDESGTALNDNEMKQKSSFAGFDFNTVWGIDEDKSYPYLRAFVSYISISSAAGRPGKDISVDVEIANNPGIAAYKLTVLYDTSKFEYIGGIDTAIVGVNGLLEVKSVNDDKSNGRVIVVAVNDSDVTEDGLLFALKFRVKTETSTGDYPLTLTYKENTDIRNEKYGFVNPLPNNGIINVIKIMRGDANGDASVDVGDLICLARHFAGIAPITDDICIEAADANNDGQLTMADLIRLARHIAEIELLPTT